MTRIEAIDKIIEEELGSWLPDRHRKVLATKISEALEVDEEKVFRTINKMAIDANTSKGRKWIATTLKQADIIKVKGE